MQPHVNSYYAATRNHTGDFPVLEELVECDVCVIGAGYTGLSSALFLAEAGYSVTVLEAAKVGFGAAAQRRAIDSRHRPRRVGLCQVCGRGGRALSGAGRD